MTAPTSITLQYDVLEDRILAVVNAGTAEASAYWLTRRLTLNLIDRANPYLQGLSPVVAKTPFELRSELATMERQVALARTEQAISHTPTDVVASASVGADLAAEITIAQNGDTYLLRMTGRNGGQASLLWSRDHLQRIVCMLEDFSAQAGWRTAPAGVSAQMPTVTKPVRH